MIAPCTGARAQSATTYQYDGLGRLKSKEDGAGAKASYQLDKAGNRQGVAVRRQFDTAWEAENLPHQIGFAHYDGWAATVQQPSAYLTYGPYTDGVPVGSRVATWRMAIDVRDVPDNSNIVVLDVWDASAGQQLAARAVSRHQWAAGGAYQVFELPFTLDAARAGHAIEMRTFYLGASYIRVEKVGYY